MKDHDWIWVLGTHSIIESGYERVFLDNTQEEVFDFIKPALNKVLQGFSCTIFAYGQTGSGKTHTMFGPNWDQVQVN